MPDATLPPLVDSHCHLTWNSFDHDRDGVLRRMQAEGVAQAVVVATDPGTARRARELCRAAPGVLFPTAGIHPNDVPDDLDGALAELDALFADRANGAFFGVGETGLDYYRDEVVKEKQHASFTAQIALARKFDLPVIVHIRDKDGSVACYDDVATILERECAKGGVRGVIHCYTGDAAHAERYRAGGFVISFSGILTFPNGENVRQAARSVPLSSTLVETDAPFLAPLPWRGKRNEPAFVAATAKKLAELHGVSEADCRRATTANAKKLFRLP